MFVISAAIYVSGAIGFEMLGAREYYNSGDEMTLLYSVFYTIEELLEMLGIGCFIYALVSYMVNQFGILTITVNDSR